MKRFCDYYRHLKGLLAFWWSGNSLIPGELLLIDFTFVIFNFGSKHEDVYECVVSLTNNGIYNKHKLKGRLLCVA